jgi:hypothetical protein
MNIMVLNLILPDHRVEKAAYLAKKAGHKLYFVGEFKESYKPAKVFGNDLFEEKYHLRFTPRNNVGLQLKSNIQKLKDIIERHEIDLIHAHNIYCAFLAEKMGIPMVLDDHEFYSPRLKYYKYKGFKGFIAHKLMQYRYPRWEKRFSIKYPIITTSKKNIEGYKKLNPNVKAFLLPNMPLLEEVKKFPINLERKSKNLKSIYTGLDDFTKWSPHRDTTGLLDLWMDGEIGELIVIGDRYLKGQKNVTSLGFVSQKKLFEELSKSHAGILGYHNHPIHYYICHNKVFNYICNGLFLVYPKSILVANEAAEIIKQELGEGFTFSFINFSEIKYYLKNNKRNIINLDRKALMELAKKHFILDNYKKNIQSAYKNAMEEI